MVTHFAMNACPTHLSHRYPTHLPLKRPTHLSNKCPTHLSHKFLIPISTLRSNFTLHVCAENFHMMNIDVPATVSASLLDAQQTELASWLQSYHTTYATLLWCWACSILGWVMTSWKCSCSRLPSSSWSCASIILFFFCFDFSMQWNIWIKDTLGAGLLSFIQRLSSGGRFDSICNF